MNAHFKLLAGILMNECGTIDCPLLFSVGSGMGPITFAPDRSAVSMMVRVD